GCYIDSIDLRTLRQTFYFDRTGMTIEGCQQFCTEAGYSIAGLEYSDQCFDCDTTIRESSSIADSSNCFMPCAGNSGQICGGPNHLSIY
ncbi:carbohydrate-binding WSC, partial [Byssothecium circinans]